MIFTVTRPSDEIRGDSGGRAVLRKQSGEGGNADGVRSLMSGEESLRGIQNLNGDQVYVRVGSTVPLDDNLDAEIDLTPPYYAWLMVRIADHVANQDRLLVSNTETVTVDPESGGIRVDGAWIGVITEDGSGSSGLVIRLLPEATPLRVQELVRALSYWNFATDTPVTGQRPVGILLEDASGSTASVNVDVFVLGAGENAPPSIQNRNSAPVAGADTAPLVPFAGVRVSDDGTEVTAVVTFDPSKGRLILGSKNFGAYDEAAGRYTITAHPDDVTEDLRALQFDPRDRSDPVGAVERTLFTISVSDGIATDSIVVKVDAVATNRSPSQPLLSNASVTEMATDGTAIGTVSGSDPNGGDHITYSLIGAEDVPFRLETRNGVVQLAVTNGIRLDFEQRQSYTLTLRATDAAGLSNDRLVNIAVGDVNPERTVGSAANDVIKGGAGRDTLGGGLGNDTLFGGLGNDMLSGNAGKDVFVFNTKTNKKTNVDRIADFVVKDDTIWLDNAVFAKIGKGSEPAPGKLTKAMFWTGKSAHDASDRIIYDKKTGALYYDADGTGKAAQVKIATLKKSLAITEKDFFVI